MIHLNTEIYESATGEHVMISRTSDTPRGLAKIVEMLLSLPKMICLAGVKNFSNSAIMLMMSFNVTNRRICHD